MKHGCEWCAGGFRGRYIHGRIGGWSPLWCRKGMVHILGGGVYICVLLRYIQGTHLRDGFCKGGEYLGNACLRL